MRRPCVEKPRNEASSISLQQDVSKGWLVLRFGSATAALESRSGFIGARHLPTTEENLHALALRDATIAILQNFAVPNDMMPFSDSYRTGYSKFMARMLPKIEMLCADGASDEQLALDLMYKVFPSLKLATRDLCHSVRRVASRTSVADPFCKRVLLVLRFEALSTLSALKLGSRNHAGMTPIHVEKQPLGKVGAVHQEQAIAMPAHPEQQPLQGMETFPGINTHGGFPCT